MERIGSSIRGIYRDVLMGPDNRVLHDSGWVSNTIVDGCRTLLAGFMKNEPSQGIQYLAVGQGLEAWDTDLEPVPATATDLENRYTPTIPDPTSGSDLALVYLDENDDVVDGPTSRLQITATLKPGYPAPLSPLTTYPLREFGFFGRFNGTDYMINAIRHPVIDKDESATLIRTIRLYF